MKSQSLGRQDELISAARSGDPDTVTTLLELGADPNGAGTSGLLPLIAAAEHGHPKVVMTLLGAGATPDVCTSSGTTPLRAAILSGEGGCITALLGAGARPDMETARGTPLTTAATVGDCETLQLLLDHGAAIDHETRDGFTALMAAVREDKRAAVQLLLRRGASPGYCSKHSNMTAMSIAQDKACWLQVLPEVYSLLLQAAVVNDADQALAASDQRRQAGMQEAQAEHDAGVVRLKQEAVHSRAQVAEAVGALQAETADLLQRLGLAKRPSAVRP
ncbi:ANK_REP_REGION domain-containing protein [Haematococcus lacustris]|uniref:ANK_REP_REGION domain-containing protein n=1 Tax=Haematococcus lacustris TaxID=44745 RepID=A0A699YAJ2_HAELA|nr:ANK_REP_REGION domain-containing protein [Haematococcus lacustris]